VVGVNRYVEADEPPPRLFRVDASHTDGVLRRLAETRAARDAVAWRRSLDELARAAAGTENLFPRVLDCVEAYATVGEITATLEKVWGRAETTLGG
jgi:methylmalonyl-CoA mutase, N-terminal domain